MIKMDEENKIQKEGRGKIGITIENNHPPVFVIDFKNLSRVSLAELIAVIDTIKLKLIGRYNKCNTTFQNG